MSHQHAKRYEQVFYWSPRVLASILIVFLAIFAFDVFVPGKSFLEVLGALFIHLVPNILLLIALFIAWKHEVSGGILFILLGVFSVLFFHTYNYLVSFLIISFPVFVIGVLFVLHNYFEKK